MKHSLGQDFCNYLEYQITRVLRHTEHPALKGFWCDGISPTATIYHSGSIDNTSQNKQIVTQAWLGKDGQTPYELKINLGPEAMASFNRGKNLKHAIPSSESGEWIEIDQSNKTASIYLN